MLNSHSKAFRDELTKLMPGYSWTVHGSKPTATITATGTQSSGFNRLSTLRVVRTEKANGVVSYEAMSSGFGLRAKWLHTCSGTTLARALRGLQAHYEAAAANYLSHAEALQKGRPVKALKVSA